MYSADISKRTELAMQAAGAGSVRTVRTIRTSVQAKPWQYMCAKARFPIRPNALILDL